jgi:hypothetical protein
VTVAVALGVCADAPDDPADVCAWTAGAVAWTADADEPESPEPPGDADAVTGAADATVDAAAPTVLVTEPTAPLALCTTLPAASLAPCTTLPTVPVTLWTTEPTAPVTLCAAWPVAVAVAPTAPVAVPLTRMTGLPALTETDTVVGVVADEPGAGLCPVVAGGAAGAEPEPAGSAVDVASASGLGEPAPLPPAGPCLCPPAERRRTGGPARTGCGCPWCRGWLVLGWMVGGEPRPNRLGGITRTATAVTKVTNAMAATMTVLGPANPAGCTRAAATTDLDVLATWPNADPTGLKILRMGEDCVDMLVNALFLLKFPD